MAIQGPIISSNTPVTETISDRPSPRSKHPWTNGYAERLNQTILDEFYSVALRKKIYTSVEQLQKDLDEFMYQYNFHRSHQGYKLKNNGYITPSQGFFSGRTCLALPLAA